MRRVPLRGGSPRAAHSTVTGAREDAPRLACSEQLTRTSSHRAHASCRCCRARVMVALRSEGGNAA